jgi:hypothetical protein
MDKFYWISFLKSLDLAGPLTAVAGCVTAWVAWQALNTWKKQLFAEKKIEFLDELTNTVHGYISEISPAVDYLKFINISIDAHSSSVFPSDKRPNAGMINFIERTGKSHQETLMSYLDKTRIVLKELSSLNAKGQVFGFDGYLECHQACANLSAVYDKLGWIALLVGSTSLNWENPEVQDALDRLKNFAFTGVRDQIDIEHTKFLCCVHKMYKGLLK